MILRNQNREAAIRRRLPLTLIDGPAHLLAIGSALTPAELRAAWVLRCLSSPDGYCNCPGMPERRQRIELQRRAERSRRRARRWLTLFAVWLVLAGLGSFENLRHLSPPHRTPAPAFRLDRG
jgi:hypothetical protein